MALNDLINKAKSYARQNPDKAKSVIEKIETTVDQKTQGKYRDKVSKAGDAVGGALGVDRGTGQGGQGQVTGDTPVAKPDPESPQNPAQSPAPEWKGTEGTDGPAAGESKGQ